jgi:hypothetical protein
MSLFKSEYVPHFILLGSDGQPLKQKTGAMDAKGIAQFAEI